VPNKQQNGSDDHDGTEDDHSHIAEPKVPAGSHAPLLDLSGEVETRCCSA
jgi:hypothetical protein